MTRKNKDYKVGTYLVKKPRPKKDGATCPTCAKCTNKDFCSHRKNVKLMKKCPDCRNCADIDNCDKFYITEQHCITIPVGVDEETGRVIRKKFSGKTENEAIYNSEQFKKDNPGGLTKKPKKINPQTIEAITLEFMKSKNENGTNGDNTFRTYTQILNRVKRNVEDWFYKPINKITRKEIEDFFNYERNLGYAQNTLKKDYQLFRQAFGIAKERKYIQEDFFSGYYKIAQPKSIKKTKKVKSFEYDDCIKLLKYLYSPDFKYSHRDEYLIAIHCGLRIGEVLALKKSDIDFENGLIHVQRTITSDKEGHAILGKHTKTPSGERDIPINELTEPVLRHAIDNMITNENNLLFCNKNGSVLTDNSLNSCLKRICKYVGIAENAHNHKLRHSFSTNGVVAGIDYKVMEETMGHSDIRITMDTYTDVQKNFQKEQLQKYVEKIKMELGDELNKFYSKDKELINT